MTTHLMSTLGVMGTLGACLLTCSVPALAIDFHPLTSQDLQGGVHEYDHIFIPAGVTLTLVGESRQATLRASADLTLAGSLVAPGWQITLQAGNSLHILGLIDVGQGGSALIGNPPGDFSSRNLPLESLPGATLERQLSRADWGGDIRILHEEDMLHGGDLRLHVGDTRLRMISRPSTFERGGDLRLHGGGIRLQAAPGLPLIKVSSPVPEPETWAMLLAGLGLLGFAARRGARSYHAQLIPPSH